MEGTWEACKSCFKKQRECLYEKLQLQEAAL